MDANTLSPCPFCGAVARMSGLGYRGAADCYTVQVCCDGCEAQGPGILVDQSEGDSEADAAAEAAAAWNRRIAPDIA